MRCVDRITMMMPMLMCSMSMTCHTQKSARFVSE